MYKFLILFISVLLVSCSDSKDTGKLSCTDRLGGIDNYTEEYEFIEQELLDNLAKHPTTKPGKPIISPYEVVAVMENKYNCKVKYKD